MKNNQPKDYSTLILRISLALVFLYFGFSQALTPDNWTGYLPGFMTNTIITPTNIVVMNGIMEIVLGIFLAIGLFTKFASLLLGLHLIGIAATIGFNPLGVRDFGLAAATLSLFFSGAGAYSVDNKHKSQQSGEQDEKTK